MILYICYCEGYPNKHGYTSVSLIIWLHFLHCSSLVSVAVIKDFEQIELGKEVISSYASWLQSIIIELRAELADEHCLLANSLACSWSYVSLAVLYTQIHLSRDGTARSVPYPPTSIKNKTVSWIWPRAHLIWVTAQWTSSFLMTLGYIKLTAEAVSCESGTYPRSSTAELYSRSVF